MKSSPTPRNTSRAREALARRARDYAFEEAARAISGLRQGAGPQDAPYQTPELQRAWLAGFKLAATLAVQMLDGLPR